MNDPIRGHIAAFLDHLRGFLLGICAGALNNHLGLLLGLDGQLFGFVDSFVVNFLRTLFNFKNLLDSFVVHGSLPSWTREGI